MKKFCCFFSVFCMFLLPVSAQRRAVFVSGESIQIHAKYDGVMISDTFEFEVEGQTVNRHPDDSVKQGDLIVEANQKEVDCCSDLNEIISECNLSSESIDVKVIRQNVQQQAKLYLYYDEMEKTFKTGFYIKDHITGVGTLTFIDPSTNRYGAVGHEIAEKATGQPALVNDGVISQGTITQINSSSMNHPGEKISKSNGIQLGTINKNTKFGIYGTYTGALNYDLMEIAVQKEVKTGKATIRTVIEGTNIQEYEIEITKLHDQQKNQIKGIEFKVTDIDLLKKTGGIVQGMSGSPIIQDGKLVGAVTHVLVNDPTRGYGIFIENMLEAAE